MEKQEVASLVQLRTELIKEFEKLRDYKNNKNAVMKEMDHAKLVHTMINRLDIILEGHVNFQ
jgi:hypothetical protein|tara:strand:- start:1262 stop:1447 length:186 start_codon:yes stop_codon:yes gene_type:complete